MKRFCVFGWELKFLGKFESVVWSIALTYHDNTIVFCHFCQISPRLIKLLLAMKVLSWLWHINNLVNHTYDGRCDEHCCHNPIVFCAKLEQKCKCHSPKGDWAHLYENCKFFVSRRIEFYQPRKSADYSASERGSCYVQKNIQSKNVGAYANEDGAHYQDDVVNDDNPPPSQSVDQIRDD